MAAVPLETFSRLTAYACAGGYTGLELDRILHDDGQHRRLLATARAASTVRAELANALLDDPEAFRTDLRAFLIACRGEFFDHTWASVVPRLREAADALRERVRQEDLATALASLSDTSEVRDGPRRVVLDKFHHGLVDVADEGLLLIPSWHGWPHLIVKHEPGLVPVVQFAVSGRGQVTPRHQVHTRLDALSDPGRLRLCRLIAREPLSTSALAERVGMTEPQVSRHLRKLREAGLVRTERDGRFVHYSLDLGEVARLGSDVLTALLQ